jgi:hypothetical protein
MAAIALANPLSTGALTKNQFAPQSEYPVANSAALTAPREQVFIVSTQAGAYHVVVRNIPPAPAQAIPTWVRPTIAAFFRIQNLADNWDSYGGKAINPDLIRESLDTLGMVMQPDSPTPSVVPMGDGGLQIEWHRKQQDLEIAFTAEEAPQFFYRNRTTGVLDEGSARETEKLIRLLRDLI